MRRGSLARVQAAVRLNASGWSVGEIATVDRLGRATWLVSESNGENLIRAAVRHDMRRDGRRSTMKGEMK